MELYVLDNQLRRSVVVDIFDSVVWTERFNDVGDLTLNLQSTAGNRNLFTPGVMLACNKSKRVMMIQTVEDDVKSDGSRVLICTGTSLESIMDDRIARDSFANGLTVEPNWVLTGLPADIARQVFQNIMVDGILDPADILPMYVDESEATPYAAFVGYGDSYIPEPTVSTTISIPPQSVLATLKSICQTFDLGFRLFRNEDYGEIIFQIYAGNDRTTTSPTLDPMIWPPVIFAPVLDNLTSTSFISSTKQYKNLAYVYCGDAAIKVYDPNVDPSVSGFDRHILMVNASDVAYPDRTKAGPGGGPVYSLTAQQIASIQAVVTVIGQTIPAWNTSLQKLTALKRLLPADLTNIAALEAAGSSTAAQTTDIKAAVAQSVAYNPTEDAAINAALTAEGLQKLANYNTVTAFSGQVPQYVDYKYDKDYSLGDLVEVRNEDGVINNVRVTEQIMSQDASGEKNYPTLSSRTVISPTQWAGWPPSQQWQDVPDPNHWADLP